MIVCALLGEGSSDRALLPILRWTTRRCTSLAFRIDWIDAHCLNCGHVLKDKVTAALRVQPCDVLFVHRDADKQPPEWRYQEIREALGEQTHVAVVPVHMTEAWLLIDEDAIRAAAGRVSGRKDLGIPKLSQLEDVADPKAMLRDALVTASEMTGHRARRFRPSVALHRLADLVEEWSSLQQFSAYQRLEGDVREVFGRLAESLARNPDL